MTHIKPVWLTIADEQGVVVERIDISEYDLNKTAATASLMDDIKQAAIVAQLRNVAE